MQTFTKRDIADSKRVSTRCVDNWVARGLLDKPLKLGTHTQSRVRWTAEQVAALDARLSNPGSVAA
jgi:hypothetical protein